jgi:mannose-1-phosphate guanylyltransferase
MIPFFEGRPLLALAVERLEGRIPPERIVVVSSRSLEGPVRDLLPDIPPENLILEPEGKNTAPAAALATRKITGRDPDGVVAMFPSDHYIPDRERFGRQLDDAARLAADGWIVTFGIRPRDAATGYGYIRAGESLEGAGCGEAHRVDAFVEKPDRPTAESYLRDGGYLWNSGIFVWGGKFFLDQVKAHAPAIHDALTAVEGDLDSPREAASLEAFYATVEKISIDYAVMERSDRIAVLPADFRWDDLGSWASLARIHDKDADGNVVVGDALLDDVSDSIVYSEEGTVALLGVRDLVVVRMGDVTLVCTRERAEEVRRLAERWRRDASR